MKQTKAAGVMSNVKQSVSKHTPEILTGFGIAGMITTTVLAVKATPKALQLIEEKKQETGEEKLTAMETVKTTYKCYIPATVVATVSIGCLIGSSRISLKRNAVLATAYKLVETGYKEYREKVVETIGEKKEEVIKGKIAKDRIDKNPVSKNEVILLDKGNTLCYDSISGRYFRCDIDVIKKAENELNRTMIYDMYVSLNDFYRHIGLKETAMGEDLGWHLDKGKLEIDYDSALTDNQEPCLVINFNIAPIYDYYKLDR